jgi:hypothetical protein
MSSLDLLKSVHYVVDKQGQPSAVQIDIDAWESLLDWLETVEDRALIREALPHLRTGPHKSGALLWDEVRAEWDMPDSERGR